MFRNRLVIQGGLFALTALSTVLVGGIWYGGAIMAILTAHEMGHYLQCRRYGVPASLPFFIPMPLSPFGTMGAVIRMRGGLYSRRAMFDIAVSGPLAGLVIAIPAAVVGLMLSRVVDVTHLREPTIPLGDSLLFSGLVRLLVGRIPEGHDVLLHPLAFAGWAGLFVTALNLLPVGQLDGGHILYALLGGRRALPISLVFMGGFAGIAAFFYPGWTPMLLLILLFGLRHPPLVQEPRPLGRVRWALGAAALLLFFVSFTPTPILAERPPARPVEGRQTALPEPAVTPPPLPAVVAR